MDGSSHRDLSDERTLLPDRERLGASVESDRRRVVGHDERLSFGWRRSSYDALLRSAESAALKSRPGESLPRADQLCIRRRHQPSLAGFTSCARNGDALDRSEPHQRHVSFPKWKQGEPPTDRRETRGLKK